MGICPRCGSWVDEGEPYCPECCYDGSDSKSEPIGFKRDFDVIRVNDTDYDRDEVEDALLEMGYDLDDLELGRVDEYELEELLNDR